MTIEELQAIVRDIVKNTCELKDKHTEQIGVPVHYAAIFAQSQDEFDDLLETVKQMGEILKETPTGPLYKVDPIDTDGGSLRIVKIRTPDQTRPERGDADFAARDYPSFKASYLPEAGFKLIERDTFEMIELMDPAFNVRVYFSNPPVEVQYGLA